MSEYKIQENKKTGMYRIVYRHNVADTWKHAKALNGMSYFRHYAEARAAMNILVDHEYNSIEIMWRDYHEPRNTDTSENR